MTDVSPADTATNVAVGTMATVTFSEAVDPNTVDSTTFTLRTGGNNVDATIAVAGDNLSATLDPTADLANDTAYTVTVTSGVQDTAGNALDQDSATAGNQSFTSSFTTAAAAGGGISLTATGYKVKGLQKADLEWSGAIGADVDVYRDGALITTTSNDGAYTDNIDNRGGGSYTYEVCEAGTTSSCSNEATVPLLASGG